MGDGPFREVFSQVVRVVVDLGNATSVVARVALEEDCVFGKVVVLVRVVEGCLQSVIERSVRVQNETGNLSVYAKDGHVTYLPPMTFASPLKILVKLLTTISAHWAISTLTKLPTVSSTTIKNPKRSARALRRSRSGERSRGFVGNSQKSERIRGVVEPSDWVETSKASSASISSARPLPKK